MNEHVAAEFPQQVVAALESRDKSRGPQQYGPGVHREQDGTAVVRPETVLRAHEADGRLRVELGTREYRNTLVQTHETEMFQFVERGPGETLCMTAEWFSAKVLRVRFGLRTNSAPYKELPKEFRMLQADPDDITTKVDSRVESATLTGPMHQLVVERDRFGMRILDSSGRTVWKQRKRDLFTSDVIDMGVLKTLNNEVSVWEALELDPQEVVVGLGERFDGVVRNGRYVDFRNKDAIGTSNTRTYINIPFYISSHGYGLFLNSAANPHWEIGTRDTATVAFGVEDHTIDYFVVLGSSPAEILSEYQRLTGPPGEPPVWSYGLWLSRNSYTSWDVVEQVVAEADAHDVPFDVVHLDTAWFEQDWNCDLKFSEERFPDAQKRMENLLSRGVRTSLWQYNFIPPRRDNDNYLELVKNRYYVAGRDGRPFAYDADSVGSWLDDAIIDFTNPDAAAWYAEKIKALVHAGASTIKVDFGEGVPDEGHYHGIAGNRVHNLYSLAYTATISDAIYEVTGERIVWARSGTSGSQRYPVHWGGDSQCSWAGLRGTLKAMLSIGVSGISFFSHDIGGFIGTPSPELYVRWAQLGLLSSHARTHGAGDNNRREPWAFGETALKTVRRFVHLRYQLVPYLVALGQKAVHTGLPVARALLLEFPEDPMAWLIEDQYMLGDALMVAPILVPLDQQPTRKFYLPEGTWYDFWDNSKMISSGEWFSRQSTIDQIPLFVRAGSFLPLRSRQNRTWNRTGPLEELRVYHGADGVFRLRSSEGWLHASLRSGRLEVEATGSFEGVPVKEVR